MNIDEPFAELVDRIYEAAIMPEQWPEVLRQFASQANSREAILMTVDGQTRHWIPTSAEFGRVAAEFYEFPGAWERTSRLLARRHPGFLTDNDAFSPEERKQTPFYADFLEPRGYGFGVATVIDLPGTAKAIVHAEGEYRQQTVPQEMLDRLDGLRPHFARATFISASLAFQRAQSAVETLNGLGFAACAVARDGEVLVTNGTFARSADHWTTRAGNRIALRDGRADAQLATAIANGGQPSGTLSIALGVQDDLPPAVVHVVPLKRDARDIFSRAAAILILATHRETDTKATPLLETLFDLTPSEAQVASRLAAGQTIEEIAKDTNKSVYTIRYQVKSILGKAGCKRQAELTRLLAQLLPVGGP